MSKKVFKTFCYYGGNKRGGLEIAGTEKTNEAQTIEKKKAAGNSEKDFGGGIIIDCIFYRSFVV